jgi:hypothetical protein
MYLIALILAFLTYLTPVSSQKSFITLNSSINQIYYPSGKSSKRFNIDVILVLNNLENKTIPYEVKSTIRKVQRKLEGIIDNDLPSSYNYTKPCRNDPLLTLPNTTKVDDILIFILPSSTSSFANGGPCFLSKDGYPRIGSVGMSLNAFEDWRRPPFTQQNLDFFRDVLLHEFLHVLGIGTLWSKNVTPYKAGQRMNYTGAHGLENYKTHLRGSGELEVETDFSNRGEHFDECLYDDELMSPVISYGSSLSSMTCSALKDLNYSVNMTRCDMAWRLPRKVPCNSEGFRLYNTFLQIDLHNDILNEFEVQSD